MFHRFCSYRMEHYAHSHTKHWMNRNYCIGLCWSTQNNKLTHSYNCFPLYSCFFLFDSVCMMLTILFRMSQFISMNNNNSTAWERKNKPIMEMRVDDQLLQHMDLRNRGRKKTRLTNSKIIMSKCLTNNSSNCQTVGIIPSQNTLRDIFYIIPVFVVATTLPHCLYYWVWRRFVECIEICQ